MSFKLIHLSDLHFHSLPIRLRDWNSKRFLGALNLLTRRSKQNPYHRIQSLVEQVVEMDWDHLVISGDLTQLGLYNEFEMARIVLEPLLVEPERVSIIPGNHDRYVHEQTGQKGFERFFGDIFGYEEILTKKLSNGWCLIGWDSCHPTPLFRATGKVRSSTLKQTEEFIRHNADEQCYVLVNHYPITFPEDFHLDPNHELSNLASIRQWVGKHYQIRLYLHGHIHQNWIHRVKRPEGPELMLVNSASSSQVLKRGQSSSFHQITIDGEELEVTPVSHRDDP